MEIFIFHLSTLLKYVLNEGSIRYKVYTLGEQQSPTVPDLSSLDIHFIKSFLIKDLFLICYQLISKFCLSENLRTRYQLNQTDHIKMIEVELSRQLGQAERGGEPDGQGVVGSEAVDQAVSSVPQYVRADYLSRQFQSLLLIYSERGEF